MIPEIVGPVTTETATQDAAANCMRRTGQRINAPTADIDLVLDVLFSEVTS